VSPADRCTVGELLAHSDALAARLSLAEHSIARQQCEDLESANRPLWASRGLGFSAISDSASNKVGKDRSMTTQAQRHHAIAQSETATSANGWLTKMIKARLHLKQSGPD
jgi:hypothetical protein